ncbi:ABC transporter permease [Cumulibacter manganitolerans]|uniref:ABC transporter permease n=1 Tax=Cumulibacter manganitolerans TaxID=1884992 RepID=UPI001294A1FD|nr:ABC transporter permease subunit [Cumulibacter manganitolerans]
MSAETVTAHGYRAGRTLPYRVELRRQLSRRRTLAVFAFMGVLPLILIGAFALGDAQNSGPDGRVNLIDVATSSAFNFVLFVFFVTTGFFLVVVFALFFGDTVASEAQWGSLRYLLAAPVPRMVLLRRKLVVALMLSVAAILALVGLALLAGWIAYGWKPVSTPVGIEIATGDMWWRLAAIVGYLIVNLLMVGSLAFYLSVRTDAPLAAVGGTVFIVIVSSILGQIDALGNLRNALPTSYNFAWIGMLGDPPDTADMASGIGWSLAYAAVLTALAFWQFRRKDVTS